MHIVARLQKHESHEKCAMRVAKLSALPVGLDSGTP